MFLKERKDNVPIQQGFVPAAVLLCLAVLTGCAAPNPQDEQGHAYLIVKATFLEEDYATPRWIWLCREKSDYCSRHDASGPIVEVNPGWYRLRCVEIKESPKTKESYQCFNKRRFLLEPHTIHFYGNIQFDSSRSSLQRGTAMYAELTRRYATDLLLEPGLIRDACASDPDIFERYPLVNLHSGDEVQLSCASWSE